MQVYLRGEGVVDNRRVRGVPDGLYRVAYLSIQLHICFQAV